MESHRFKAGDKVFFSPNASDWHAQRGLYEIVRPMPQVAGDNQYRVRFVEDGHERVVWESQLGANGRSLAIETLAQTLYEASDRSGTPWAKRSRTIRDAWVATATKHLV